MTEARYIVGDTRAVLGSRSCHKRGCGHPDCRVASNLYERDYLRQRRREGYRIQPTQRRMSPAQFAQRHIAYLQAHGADQPTIARIARVSVGTIKRISWGRYTKIRTTTANKILGVPLYKVTNATVRPQPQPSNGRALSTGSPTASQGVPQADPSTCPQGMCVPIVSAEHD